MSTTTNHTHITRALSARQHLILVLHCRSYDLTHSSHETATTYVMTVEGLSTAQADALAKLEEHAINNHIKDVPYLV